MGKLQVTEFCYKCGAIATTKEHVPPRGIFPEQKDIGINLRMELITVPSCDEHNGDKSKDDEFLMASLAGIVGNNLIGYTHNKLKIARALTKRESLLDEVLPEREAKVVVSEGIEFPIWLGKPDMKRLLNCFDHIAYGLYYHEFRKVYEGKSRIMPAFIDFIDITTQNIKILLEQNYANEGQKWPIKGENSSVFYYQVSPVDQYGTFSIVMTFYEGTRIFAVFESPYSMKPFNLVTELIKAGQKVTLEFEDGIKIAYNENGKGDLLFI